MKSNLKLFSMLFGAAFVMLLAGCGESPVDVARKYHKAVYKDADASKAIEYVAKDFKEDTKDTVKNIQAEKNISYGDAKIDGDTAKVRVTTKNAKGDKSTAEFQLEKENGAWKISKIKPVDD